MTLTVLHMAYKDLSGNPYSGSVLVQATSPLQDTVAGASIGLTGVTVTLDGSGAGLVSLPRTDDPTVTPGNPALNSWCYKITENVVSPGGFPEARQPFYIDLPASLGASAILADIPHYGARPGFGWFSGPF